MPDSQPKSLPNTHKRWPVSQDVQRCNAREKGTGQYDDEAEVCVYGDGRWNTAIRRSGPTGSAWQWQLSYRTRRPRYHSARRRRHAGRNWKEWRRNSAARCGIIGQNGLGRRHYHATEARRGSSGIRETPGSKHNKSWRQRRKRVWIWFRQHRVIRWYGLWLIRGYGIKWRWRWRTIDVVVVVMKEIGEGSRKKTPPSPTLANY